MDAFAHGLLRIEERVDGWMLVLSLMCRMIDELRISTSDRDICEPLDTRSVCQSLNDSGALCQPSKWAGEAIQEALNATRAAMTSLESTLHFYVSSDPYDRNRNTSGLIFRIRKQVAK